jgi:hypothetical protein
VAKGGGSPAKGRSVKAEAARDQARYEALILEATAMVKRARAETRKANLAMSRLTKVRRFKVQKLAADTQTMWKFLQPRADHDTSTPKARSAAKVARTTSSTLRRMVDKAITFIETPSDSLLQQCEVVDRLCTYFGRSRKRGIRTDDDVCNDMLVTAMVHHIEAETKGLLSVNGTKQGRWTTATRANIYTAVAAAIPTEDAIAEAKKVDAFLLTKEKLSAKLRMTRKTITSIMESARSGNAQYTVPKPRYSDARRIGKEWSDAARAVWTDGGDRVGSDRYVRPSECKHYHRQNPAAGRSDEKHVVVALHVCRTILQLQQRALRRGSKGPWPTLLPPPKAGMGSSTSNFTLHSCNGCGEPFLSEPACRQHQRFGATCGDSTTPNVTSMHTADEPPTFQYVCTGCSKRFKQRGGVNKHQTGAASGSVSRRNA